MWVVRAYNPADDELVDELALPALRLADAEWLLGFAPSKFGSTPLGERDLARLAERFGFPIRKGAEYFLDFDADPQPVGRDHAPAPAAAAR